MENELGHAAASIKMDLYDIILTLLALNKDNQDKYSEDNKHILGSVSWLLEFGTVTLSVGRRAGHTTAVTRIAGDLYHTGNRVLVVTDTKLTREWLEVAKGTNITVTTFTKLKNDPESLRGLELNFAVIEPCCLMKGKLSDTIINLGRYTTVEQVLCIS